jgi:hypothetical protein
MTDDKKGGGTERWAVPAGIAAFCGAAIWLSTTFERMPPILKRGIQPSDFPQLVAGLIIALTLLMIWRDPVRIGQTLGRTTWGSLGLMALFAALTTFDFFLALAVFAAALAMLWGERRPLLLAVVGVMVPLGVFLLFDLVFEIRFPRGVLTGLWYG